MLCSILLLDPDGLHVRHGAAPSLPRAFVEAIDGQPIGPSAGSCGTAAFRREPVVVEDIATDSLWDDYRESALGARPARLLVDADRRRGASVLGTFALYFRAPGRPSERHRRLIELSTHTAAIAISQHRETQALRISEKRLRLAVTGGNVGIWEWNAGSRPAGIEREFKAILGWAAERCAAPADVHGRDPPRGPAAKWRLRSHANGGPAPPSIASSASSRAGRAALDRGQRPWRIRCRRRAGPDDGRRPGCHRAEARRRGGVDGARPSSRKRSRSRISGSYEWDIVHQWSTRSEELCRIFGLQRDEFPPTFEAYLERVHPDDRAANRGSSRTPFATGTPFEFDERILRPDGTVRLLHSQGRWFDRAGCTW